MIIIMCILLGAVLGFLLALLINSLEGWGTWEVIEENTIEAKIEKVTDINTFADMGVFLTPGLLINGTIVSSGKLPTESDIEKWIKKDKMNK